MSDDDDEDEVADTSSSPPSKSAGNKKEIQRMKKHGESDDDVISRALAALDAMRIVEKALPKTDFKKVLVIAKNMRHEGYSEEVAVALVRALMGSQSDKDMKKAFEIFDKDANGNLDKPELNKALRLMGENVPTSRIKELFKLVDADGSGEIGLSEFTTLVKGMNPKEGSDEGGAANPFAAFQSPLADFSNPLGGMPDFSNPMAGMAANNPLSGMTDGFSAASVAMSSNIQGLNPMEMRKAGVMLENMKKAGYSTDHAETVVTAVLVDQSDTQMKKAFRFFDKDSSGVLDTEELKKALPLMGEDVTPEYIEDLFKQVDADGDEGIDLQEFSALVRGMNPKDKSADDPGFLASAQSAFAGYF